MDYYCLQVLKELQDDEGKGVGSWAVKADYMTDAICEVTYEIQLMNLPPKELFRLLG